MNHHAQPDPSIDEGVRRLAASKKMWASEPLHHRRNLLLEVGDAVAANAEEWVSIAADIKRLPNGSPLIGEEWTTGPLALLNYTAALAKTLDSLALRRDPLAGIAVKAAPAGRLSLKVLPHSNFERLMLSGYSAKVWMRPGMDLDAVRAGIRQRVVDQEQSHGVSLVLGAGNVFSTAPLDVLYQLYARSKVCLLKLHPVTNPLLPIYERIFAPFINRWYVAMLTGGAELGGVLASHPDVDVVHLTGAESTHDRLVWGSGVHAPEVGATRTPLINKTITSELGGVAPVIVVPGEWSAADITFQAQHVATQRLHNSGHNRNATQIVVISTDWPQKHEFLSALRRCIIDAPDRPMWYPDAENRLLVAQAHYPDAQHLGHGGRTLLLGLDLAEPSEPAFSTEYFCPVLGVAEIGGVGLEFLHTAIALSNTNLRGTLGATLIIDPAMMRAFGPDLQGALAELRYGTIGVNAWTWVGSMTARATSGAFPGHELTDIQSGRGVSRNAMLLSGAERTVISAPFRPAPRSLLRGEFAFSPIPLWFVNNRTAATTARLLTKFVHQPHLRSVPAILASAARG